MLGGAAFLFRGVALPYMLNAPAIRPLARGEGGRLEARAEARFGEEWQRDGNDTGT